MTRRKNTQDKDALLAVLPPDAERVQVKDITGAKKWRPVDEVEDTDFILTNKVGIPYTMKSSPGRKQTPEVAALSPVIAEIAKRRLKHVEADPILQAVRRDPESAEVVQGAMIGLAVEAASLEFERSEAERKGEDSSAYSMRRINALKAQVDTWMRRKDQAGAKSLDLDSPAFGSVFDFIVDTFVASMKAANMRGEQISAVQAVFSRKIDADWMVEAKGRVKSAGSGK